MEEVALQKGFIYLRTCRGTFLHESRALASRQVRINAIKLSVAISGISDRRWRRHITRSSITLKVDGHVLGGTLSGVRHLNSNALSKARFTHTFVVQRKAHDRASATPSTRVFLSSLRLAGSRYAACTLLFFRFPEKSSLRQN